MSMYGRDFQSNQPRFQSEGYIRGNRSGYPERSGFRSTNYGYGGYGADFDENEGYFSEQGYYGGRSPGYGNSERYNPDRYGQRFGARYGEEYGYGRGQSPGFGAGYASGYRSSPFQYDETDYGYQNRNLNRPEAYPYSPGYDYRMGGGTSGFSARSQGTEYPDFHEERWMSGREYPSPWRSNVPGWGGWSGRAGGYGQGGGQFFSK